MGESLHFRGNVPEDKRTITAARIAETIRHGDKIDIWNAVITGELDLKYAEFPEEVRLVKCRFKDRVDFSYARFKRNLILTGTTFEHGVSFSGATLEGDGRFFGARFLARPAHFGNMQVKGTFSARRARFGENVGASFRGSQFRKSVVFSRAIFGGEAGFDQATIDGHAEFLGVTFKHKVSFNSAKVLGAALFRAEENGAATTFEGEADFIAVNIGSNAEFDGAIFKGKVEFYGARIDGSVYFRRSGEKDKGAPVTFEAEAGFSIISIAGDVEFDGVKFNSKDKPVNFAGAKVSGSVYFRRGEFSEVIFHGVNISGDAVFSGARFKQKVRFDAATIDGGAFFGPDTEQKIPAATFENEADFQGTEFGQWAFFDRTQFRGEAKFGRAHFAGDAAFRGAKFKAKVHFDGARIGGALFLRGEPTDQIPPATFEDEAHFPGVHIGLVADFSGVKFTQEKPEDRPGDKDKAVNFAVNFDGARIEGSANFSGALFSKRFRPTFQATEFCQWAFFDRTEFQDEVRFHRARFAGDAAFRGAKFKAKVHFDGARIGGGLFFRGEPSNQIPPATFEDEAHFPGVHIGLVADFSGIKFMPEKPEDRPDDKDKAVDFDGARIEGDAVFSGAVFSKRFRPTFQAMEFCQRALFDGTEFQDEVRFHRARFAGDAVFRGAKFKAKVHFDGARIGGGLFFRGEPSNQIPPATFEDEAHFPGVHIGLVADFNGVKFMREKPGDHLEDKDKAVIFDGAKIEGIASFSRVVFSTRFKPSFQATEFCQTANFEQAEFHSGGNFRGVKFCVNAYFRAANFHHKATFEGAHFGGLAQFSQASKAEGGLPGTSFAEVFFDHAHFEWDARFEGAVFKAKASFRETYFRALYLSTPEPGTAHKQFQGHVDLRGCTYERLNGDWRSLFDRFERDYHDRQPYTQLETAFRKVGQDRKADRVYLKRRKVERKHRWRLIWQPMEEAPDGKKKLSWFFNRVYWLGAWLGDCIYWLGARYGIRPYQLVALGLAFLFLGTAAFQCPGAAQAKKPTAGSASQPTETPKSTPPEPETVVLSPVDAFRLTVRLLVPVELPLSGDWEPSQNHWWWCLHFSDLGAFLKVFAWIGWTVGIAAITRVLRRVAA